MKHLDRILVIVLEFQGFMIEAYRFVELAAEVVDKGKGKVGLGIGRVQINALL